MLSLTPIVLALLYGVAFYWFSAWRLSRQLDAASKPLRDPRLQRAIGTLAVALDLPRVRVQIYDIAPINGLAAPDGRIFITSGFYTAYQTGMITVEEMASVIAHELGHVALGHSRRRMIDFSSQNALRTIIMIGLNRVLPIIGPYIANALIALLMARLSRTDEFEADAYASALLIKAGIGTGPQKTLFRKLEKLTGGGGATTPAWLLSHPKPQDRIAAINTNEAKWNQSRARK